MRQPGRHEIKIVEIDGQLVEVYYLNMDQFRKVQSLYGDIGYGHLMEQKVLYREKPHIFLRLDAPNAETWVVEHLLPLEGR